MLVLGKGVLLEKLYNGREPRARARALSPSRGGGWQQRDVLSGAKLLQGFTLI